jgi:hypothetical protein
MESRGTLGKAASNSDSAIFFLSRFESSYKQRITHIFHIFLVVYHNVIIRLRHLLHWDANITPFVTECDYMTTALETYRDEFSAPESYDAVKYVPYSVMEKS